MLIVYRIPREYFRHLLIEGYKSTNLEDKVVNNEWEQASMEKWG